MLRTTMKVGNVQRKSSMKEVLGNNKSNLGGGRLPLPLPLPPQPRQGSFRLIRSEDGFFSRLLSKETSLANPSFRVYYGGIPGSIPFLWETQPGTPKHVLHNDPLPPLTPPPSYYTKRGPDHGLAGAAKKTRLRWSSSLLRSLVRRKPKGGRAVPSPAPLDFSSSASSTSSSSSALSMLTQNSSKRRRGRRRGRGFLNQGSMSFDSRIEDEEMEKPGGPPSPGPSPSLGSRKKWRSLSNVGWCFSLNF
ncbi:hypothetical protein MLD38_038376 [Melastoma candidum]|uniref:Uncharacterized protein n=1 Tax=Melastoma candidum TaxID=119954 RepID=A0ACB9KZD2_9MYRT|nr:hypothetical protein MLD38_038376 [Melastoma candidum]